MTDDQRLLYVTALQNTHALELQALQIMERQVERLERYPEMEQLLRRHIKETHQHRTRLEEALDAVAETPSTLKEGVLGMMGNMAALAHAPAQDEVLKNAFANRAFENYEAAAYEALLVFTDAAGQSRFRSAFEQSLSDENRTAQAVADLVPLMTRRYIELTTAGRQGGPLIPTFSPDRLADTYYQPEKSMKFTSLIGASALVALSSSAWAQSAATDADFATKASVGNTFEVTEGKLAETQAANPKVKAFARMMISDHTKAEKMLQTAAKAAGTPVEMSLDAPHQSMVDALKDKKGADFDKAYVADQVQAHTETAALLTDYQQSGDKPQLKAWAKKSLPVVNAHLKKVQAMSSM